MSQPALKNAVPDAHLESAPRAAAPRGQKKISVFLVTPDESLWPLIGPRLDTSCVLKQVDTVEELQRNAPAGQSAVVLWDARETADAAAELSRVQLHSPRFAIVVLDVPARRDGWRPARRQRQISAILDLPFDDASLLNALSSATEECHARAAVLDDGAASSAAAGATEATPPRKSLWWALSMAAVLAAFAAAYFIYRHYSAPAIAARSQAPAATPTATAPTTAPAPLAAPATAPASAASPADTGPGTEEQVDALLEKARAAMRERHFIDPAANNALSLYQSVLTYDPNNGEARQGLQRLAQILVARVQAYLDDRKYDLALQALETARSLSPGDPHFAELDARVASLRAELGASQIHAAIAAKNFDRATQLIDEAGRAKSLSNVKLNQLREELKRERAAADAAGVLSLMALRIQQGRLIEPQSDSAVYYLKQAQVAGASPADLAEPTQELAKKLMLAARTAIDEHRLGDAARLLEEAQRQGAAPKAIAAMRADMDAQKDGLARAAALRTQALALAQSRLAQGQLLEPSNDNVLYYLNQLRAADPSNPQLPQLSAALESAILLRARAALDAGDAASANSLIASASALGPSPELDALRGALAGAQSKSGAAEAAKVPVSADSLVAVKPLQLEYPPSALTQGIEGWVDLSFLVTRDGKVTDVAVVNSSPHNVFESAAKHALSRVRYRPVMIDGHAMEVASTVRIAFRLAKP